MRLMSICPCNQKSGFSATLQVRRGKWGERPAVYKIWDLTRDAGGIHELFHEISILTHLQALQVMLFSYYWTGLCCTGVIKSSGAGQLQC